MACSPRASPLNMVPSVPLATLTKKRLPDSVSYLWLVAHELCMPGQPQLPLQAVTVAAVCVPACPTALAVRRNRDL